MSAGTAAVLLHLALCCALFWSVFCRSVMSSERVKLDVRFAFFLLGAVAIFGAAAPWVWAFRPGAFSLALLGAIVLVQITTATHWRHGVPSVFLRPCKAQKKDGQP